LAPSLKLFTPFWGNCITTPKFSKIHSLVPVISKAGKTDQNRTRIYTGLVHWYQPHTQVKQHAIHIHSISTEQHSYTPQASNKSEGKTPSQTKQARQQVKENRTRTRTEQKQHSHTQQTGNKSEGKVPSQQNKARQQVKANRTRKNKEHSQGTSQRAWQHSHVHWLAEKINNPSKPQKFNLSQHHQRKK